MTSIRRKTANRTYYVAVGPGQILTDPETAAFEFAIRGTEAEIDKLEEKPHRIDEHFAVAGR